MKLRIHIPDLLREIAEHIIDNNHRNNMIEQAPNMWVGLDYPEFFAIKMGFHSEVVQPGRQLYSVRFHQNNKGYNLFYDVEEVKCSPIRYGKTSIGAIKKGMTHKVYRTKTVKLRLFISNEGNVTFSTTKLSHPRYLTYSNRFQVDYISKFTVLLLTLRNSMEWLYHQFNIVTAFDAAFDVALDLPRSCTNLQQFINKINITSFPVSANQFRHHSIEDIFTIIKLTNFAVNPCEVFNNVDTFCNSYRDHQFKQLLNDYIQMSKRINTPYRLTCNIKKMKELHDKAVLIFINQAPTKKDVQLTVGVQYKKLLDFLPVNFTIIESENELIKLGIVQKHCVGSYGAQINNGSVGIFKVIDKEETYTADVRGIEILYSNQFRGYANKNAPDELNYILLEAIDAYNKENKLSVVELKLQDTEF